MLHIHLQTLIGVAALVTWITPYAAAVFTQMHFPRWVNAVIAFSVSIVFGIISWFSAGGTITDVHDIGSLLSVVSAVSVASKVYYEKLAKNDPLLPAIEWWSGGKQAGFPKPVTAFLASTSVSGDPLPTGATDTDAPVVDDPSQTIRHALESEIVRITGGEPSASLGTAATETNQ